MHVPCKYHDIFFVMASVYLVDQIGRAKETVLRKGQPASTLRECLLLADTATTI